MKWSSSIIQPAPSTMVGVPGKFKGCETCRLRRREGGRPTPSPSPGRLPLSRPSDAGAGAAVLQCDNGRPFCKKCIDTGRDCAGYERETVFIIGTPEDGGRCSSHPPRVIKSKKARPARPSKAGAEEDDEPAEKLELVPVAPLQPAWDDLVPLSTGAAVYHVQVAALHTSLRHVGRQLDEGSDVRFAVAFNPYAPADLRPSMTGDDFELQSQCVVHLAPVDPNLKPDPEITATDSICLFLYEVCVSVSIFAALVHLSVAAEDSRSPV